MEKKLIRFGLFCLLFVLGFVLAIICYKEEYVTSFQKNHGNLVQTNSEDGLLLQGRIFRGSFTSFDDNLGVVKIRFNSYNRRNVDRIEFRIRERGSSEWFTNNSILTERITGGLLYPFGFPVISDSKGKIYEFELESENGTTDNAIGVDGGTRTLVTEYSYPKELLMRNLKTLHKFLWMKGSRLLSSTPFLLFLSIFLLPSFLFLIPQKVFRKNVPDTIAFLYFLYATVIYSYQPLNLDTNTLAYIFLYFIMTFLVLFSSRLASLPFNILGLCVIVQIPLVIAFRGNDLILSKLGISSFYVFVLSVLLSTVELRNKRKIR